MSDLTTAEYAKIAQDLADRYSAGYIGVGDGIDVADPADTDLQGTNKARAAITSVLVSGSTVTFYATFAAGVASFEWLEAGLFEEAVAGHMGARKVIESPGTKGASQIWTYALEIDCAPS